MSSKMKKIVITFTMMIAVLVQPISVMAKAPYKTYSQNGYGEMVETQTAYLHQQTLIKITDPSGNEEFDGSLDKPQDIKIISDEADKDNSLVYIADTGHKRIVVSDLAGNLIQVIGEGYLEEPTGIHVMKDKTLYVADKSLKKVVVYDANGQIIVEYGKPNSPLFGENKEFTPMKIAVADGGTMYIVSETSTEGIIQLTPKDGGTFLGYFGTNQTSVSFVRKLQEMLLSDSQKGQLNNVTAASISNVGIDVKGLIYTLTTDASAGEMLRKLNISGTNLMHVSISPLNGVAICNGNYENFYVASSDGYVYEYSKDGSLLFLYGGQDSGNYRDGLFSTPSAIAVDETDRIYVLDSVANEVQIFETTEFTDLVHSALALYYAGKYTESKEPLEEVIRMNGLFDYANRAMGQALFQEEDFRGALKYYRLAKSKMGYSEAYWEIRNIWLKNNLFYALIAIVVFVIVIKGIQLLNRKTKIFVPIRKVVGKLTSKTLWKQTTYGLTYMKHPMDGAYAVKRQGMKSYLAAFILTLILIVFNIVNKYFCGFFVKTVRDGEYNVATDIISVLFILIFMSSVTYLICTISDGEGRFKEILCGYVYSLTPYLIILPMIYLVGHVVTANEIFIIEFANVIMFTWVVILLFLTIKEVNNYSVKETFKIIGLTIFAAFIFILIAFVLYVLASQVIEFVKAVYGEAVYRIGRS